jgi:hypothetical protein
VTVGACARRGRRPPMEAAVITPPIVATMKPITIAAMITTAV